LAKERACFLVDPRATAPRPPAVLPCSPAGVRLLLCWDETALPAPPAVIENPVRGPSPRRAFAAAGCLGLAEPPSPRDHQLWRKSVAMPTPRRIKVNHSGEVTIVTFVDSKIIDEQEIQEFGQELYDLVERDHHKKIVLNFAKVEFLSSAALGKLIGFDKRVKQHGATLALCNIRPEIYEVFAITKLTKLFVIKDSEADALAVI
jgi:anti-sigma B factor antagonist